MLPPALGTSTPEPSFFQSDAVTCDSRNSASWARPAESHLKKKSKRISPTKYLGRLQSWDRTKVPINDQQYTIWSPRIEYPSNSIKGHHQIRPNIPVFSGKGHDQDIRMWHFKASLTLAKQNSSNMIFCRPCLRDNNKTITPSWPVTDSPIVCAPFAYPKKNPDSNAAQQRRGLWLGV